MLQIQPSVVDITIIKGRDMNQKISKLLKVLQLIRNEISVDIPVQQIAILLLVSQRKPNDPISMPEIKLALNMPQGSVSRNVRMLSRFTDSKKGSFRGYDLVETRPDMYERRRLSVSLTEKGKKLVAKIEQIWA